MNEKPISKSRDVVLRKSEAALQRAAQRARKLARQTGTSLIVSRGGKVHRIDMTNPGVAESPGAYDADTKHVR